jgi:hypothetical protein
MRRLTLDGYIMKSTSRTVLVCDLFVLAFNNDGQIFGAYAVREPHRIRQRMPGPRKQEAL